MHASRKQAASWAMTLGIGLCLCWATAALAEQPQRPPVIVLDPGHGGSNTGAFGPTLQRHEKHLTLLVAKATAARLRRLLPAARILLTRYDDRYVTLQARAQQANAAEADVFVSVHFNASESHQLSGFETYVLSRKASDLEAQRVARAEGAGLGQQKGADPAPSRIVAELSQQGARMHSVVLANTIQRALARARPKAKNRGVRRAPFDVLMGLHRAGVLVELGFIDHPQESRELNQPDTQAALASALAAAVIDYLSAGDRKLSSR